MIIVILILFVFMMFLFIGHSKTRLMIIYLLSSAGIVTFAVSLLLYSVRIWNYTGIFEFEYSIYCHISKMLPLNYYTVIDIISVSIGLYMVSMWVAGWFFVKRRFDAKKLALCVGSLIPAIVHVIINLQYFTLRLHYWVCENPQFAHAAATFFNAINLLIMIYYIIFLFVAIYIYNKSTRIIYQKKVNNIFAVTILMMCLFFLFYYKIAFFDFKCINFENLLRYTAISADGISGTMYIAAIFITFVTIEITYYMFIKYHVFYDWIVLYRRRTAKNLTISLNDARPMLHSCKNNFLSSDFMIKDAINDVKKNKISNEELVERLEEIDLYMINSMNDIGAVLNVAKNKSISYVSVDLYDCIKEALKGYCVQGIKLENKVQQGEFIVLGDKREIVHILENILCNAVEALYENPKGKIEISGYADKKWVYIFIHDNGCGIEHSNLKKVFRPLFSTKKTKANWGVGLSYVNNMMRTHKGMVFIDNKPGEYTEVQLQFPIIIEMGE